MRVRENEVTRHNYLVLINNDNSELKVDLNLGSTYLRAPSPITLHPRKLNRFRKPPHRLERF